MKSARRILAALVFLIAPWAWSRFNPHSSSWLVQEGVVATAKLIKNISANDAVAGVVLASPSRAEPNYYYHWVRDGALTMDVVVELWASAPVKEQADLFEKKIRDYVEFSRSNQNSNSLTGLGEPKFNADGTPFSGAWARPQNDGPALRAITLIHYARAALLRGQTDFVRTTLYDGKPASRSVIKRDLEFVAHHWKDPSFDLWEEVEGDHFYTRMVQRKALYLGADLARKLGDPAAADDYFEQARAIEATLTQFWDPKNGYIHATANYMTGLNYKKSSLDTAILLGALHGGMDDGFFDWNDDRVQQTLNKLDLAFNQIYPLNNQGEPAVALGRYPEDLYNGTGFTGGNPWVLTTLAAAELEYRRAIHCRDDASADFARAEAYVQRVAAHAGEDGSLSEQVDRKSGAMVSARDLTWNYAAVLTARDARRAALSACPSLH